MTPSLDTTTADHLLRRCSQMLAAAALVSFVLISSLGAVNVPVGDDFAVLASVLQLREAPTLQDFLHELIAPHNEHRIMLTRLCMLATSFLPGGVDFRVVALAGNAALLAALGLICRLLGTGWSRQPWGMAALLMVVLQLQLQKLLFYPMASVQAFSCILFGLAYVWFGTLGRRPGWAFAFYALSLTTSSAAIFLPLLCTLTLLMMRRPRLAAIQLAMGVVFGGLYLMSATTSSRADLAWALEHPSVVITLFLELMGSAAEIPFYRWSMFSGESAMVLGCLLLTYTACLAWQGLNSRPSPARNTVLAACVVIGFCLMLTALVSVKRSHQYEHGLLAAAQDARYRIYGLLVAGVSAAVALMRIGHTRLATTWRGGGLLLLAGYSLVWHLYPLASVWHTQQARLSGIQHWARTGDPSRLMYWSTEPAVAATVLQRAVAAGVYHPPVP